MNVFSPSYFFCVCSNPNLSYICIWPSEYTHQPLSKTKLFQCNTIREEEKGPKPLTWHSKTFKTFSQHDSSNTLSPGPSISTLCSSQHCLGSLNCLADSCQQVSAGLPPKECLTLLWCIIHRSVMAAKPHHHPEARFLVYSKPESSFLPLNSETLLTHQFCVSINKCLFLVVPLPFARCFGNKTIKHIKATTRILILHSNNTSSG